MCADAQVLMLIPYVGYERQMKECCFPLQKRPAVGQVSSTALFHS